MEREPDRLAGASLATDAPAADPPPGQYPLEMTEDQWKRFLVATHGFPYHDESGVDLSLLQEGLQRSPEDRLAGLGQPGSATTRLARALNERGVRYVLIGGVAMRLHGSAYVTQDVDLYYARDQQNLEALAAALAEFRPRLRRAEDLPFRWDARTLAAGCNFTLATTLGDIDVLGDVRAAPFEEVLARAVRYRVAGLEVPAASLPDLMDMKRAAGRTKDAVHLLEMRALLRLIQEEAGKGP